jgi:hypothetical protein
VGRPLQQHWEDDVANIDHLHKSATMCGEGKETRACKWAATACPDHGHAVPLPSPYRTRSRRGFGSIEALQQAAPWALAAIRDRLGIPNPQMDEQRAQRSLGADARGTGGVRPTEMPCPGSGG